MGRYICLKNKCNYMRYIKALKLFKQNISFLKLFINENEDVYR